MNLVLSAEQALLLHELLCHGVHEREEGSYAALEQLRSQLKLKIVEAIDSVNAEKNKRLFEVWENKESERLTALEHELKALKTSKFEKKHEGILKSARCTDTNN